ncbi:MAG: MmgE/PrpD family protein [Promethearchaeota archaeon]
MEEKKVTKNRLEELLGTVRKDPYLVSSQLDYPSITEPLAKYISETQFSTIPDEILELAKRHILDTLASMVVSTQLKPSRLARQFAIFNGGKADTAHLLTTNQTTTLLDAIFANAITAHAAEINDFCPSAFVQPGPPIISTVLSIGETIGASGEELLKAVVIGYEIACKLPKALGTMNLRTAGLSSHGVGPTFGSAAAAATLLKLPKREIGYVLAYCVQQASGSFNWIRDEEHIEKAFLFAGMPARNGASAALMVHKGFTGVKDPFKGRPNWLLSSIFIGIDSDLDLNRLIHDLGVKYEIPLVGYKRYPVGGPIQASIEGLMELIKRIDRTSIIKIEIKMPGSVSIFSDAEMPALNLRYLTAVILEDGDLSFTMAQSHERMSTETIREKMEFITLIHDPTQEKEPRVESALVKVTLKDGRDHEIFIEHVLGFPERPMNHQDVEHKAKSLITPILGHLKANKLIETIWNLENLLNIKSIIPLLIPSNN